MSQRAQTLAERLQREIDDAVELVNCCTDSGWTSRVPGDGRTVNVMMHHIAAGNPVIVALALQLAAGERPTPPWADGPEELNAKHARRHADVSRA